MIQRDISTKVLRKKLTLIFNEFIRLRDRKKGCISCVKGRVENAGHFRSTGSAPQASMRFDERNVNGQCIRCNFTLGGNPDGYRVGLLKKYGPTVLRELEIKKSLKGTKWGVFEFEAMISDYKKRVKKLKGEIDEDF